MIHRVGDSIVVRQTYEGHRKTVRLLNEVSACLVEVDRQQGRLPAYRPCRLNATPRERWLHQLMDQPCPQLDFPGETPLAAVLEEIADHFSAGPKDAGKPTRLRFVTDWSELLIEGVDSLDSVTVRDIHLDGQRLKNALLTIFRQTDPHLTVMIYKETLLVTSASRAHDMWQVRAYPVAQLKRQLFDGNPSQLMRLIIDTTQPPAAWYDIDGTGGSIQRAGDTLVITQIPPAHDLIADRLNQLAASLPR